MAENIRPYIIINGKSSRVVSGLLIVSLPPITKPQMRVSAEEINGRDGDIVTELGFSAYDKPVEIGLAGDYDINEVISYFNQAGIITFSNEPDKYYRFAQYNGIDFEKLIRFKTATVIFHCQPFKYSKDENDAVFWNPENITIENAGNIYSKPQLAIQGSGNVGITLNGSEVLSIAFGETQQAIIIDSDKMNAYGTKSNIKSLVADINPVQDLHGYDYPWKAGGGKNLIPFPYTNSAGTYNGITVTVNNDGTLILNGTATSTVFFNLVSNNQGIETLAGDYILHKPTIETISGINITVAKDGAFWVNATAQNVNLNLSENALLSWYIRIASGTTLSNVKVYPMFEKGTIATEWTPYENICLITGWDEVNVTHTSGEMSAPVSLDFGQTVYGGTINLTTGLLKVTHIGHSFDGSESFITVENNKYLYNFGQSVKSSYSNYMSTICSHFKVGNYGGWADVLPNEYIIAGSYYFGVNPNMTLSDFQAYLAEQANNGTPVVVVATLITPQTIQLTAQEIEAFIGTNVIYADTGAISELIYTKDGAEITTSGDIVSFDVDASDIKDDILKNRLVTGNYDNLRLKAGSNQIGITGDVDVLVFSNFSRWL